MRTRVWMLLVMCGCSPGVGVFEPSPTPGSTPSTPTPIPPAPTMPPPVPPPPEHAPPGLGVTQYVPLFAADTPVLEQTQYTEPDGTLVTYAGFRPTNRHQREGGEPWTSAVDEGTGNFFSFPTFYFQNRTYGLVIRDEVPAGRQKITVFLKPNFGTFINNGFSAFRRIDGAVIEYGWKMGVGFDNLAEGNKRCHASDRIEDLCVAQSITDYWRLQDERDFQGSTRTDKRLLIGDKIEMSPAQFLDNTNGTNALIDNGGVRYYSFEQLYVVGKGMVPWYGIAPRLDSHPLPPETLSGGQASVSFNYSEEPHRVFQQSANNIGIANMQRFVEGRRLFHTSFLDGKHSESPDTNPVFTQHAGQLGPRYNAVRCLGCHTLNGRSPAATVGSPLTTFAVLTAKESAPFANVPHPTYGLNVQQLARTGAGTSVSVASYERSERILPDGTRIELKKPVYAFSGERPAHFSVRQAMQVIGMGLLEAIDEPTIFALADPNDADGDGVRGVPNWSIDRQTGGRRLGRFGWKASKASLHEQSASAFLLDMGVTTPLYTSVACQKDPTAAACTASTEAPAVSAKELDQMANYLRLLGVPAQRSLRSGFTDGIVVPPEHQVDASAIARGQVLFAQARCTSCHVATLKTGQRHPLQEMRDQVIHPYTDLLLHDLGEGLADTLTDGQAGPQLWRTQPLWGLGALAYVQKSTGEADPLTVRYLHDGRASTLLEAIAWHGGEATSSRSLFEALGRDDRAAILSFLESL